MKQNIMLTSDIELNLCMYDVRTYIHTHMYRNIHTYAYVCIYVGISKHKYAYTHNI